MTDCCNDKVCEIELLRSRQSSMLKVVFGINAIMFVVELTAGLLAGSVSLIADSLDMLGDALVYGFSLYVVARDERMKAVSALLKGGIMAIFGLFVLGQAIYKIILPQIPVFEAMGSVGLLALAANSVCLLLLWQHRADDINMRSVWLCSRNDIIANCLVLMAAVSVWLTHSGWPDIIVGLAIAILFLRSALLLLRESTAILRSVDAEP